MRRRRKISNLVLITTRRNLLSPSPLASPSHSLPMSPNPSELSKLLTFIISFNCLSIHQLSELLTFTILLESGCEAPSCIIERSILLCWGSGEKKEGEEREITTRSD